MSQEHKRITEEQNMPFISEALKAIVDGTSREIGEDYLQSLSKNLALALKVKYVLITICSNKPVTKLRTVAFWVGSAFKDNYEYDLIGTPCNFVINDRAPQYIPKDLEVIYPKEKGFESYQAVPLLDSKNEMIGHMAVLDDVPMPPDEEKKREAILRYFSARAEAELERLQIEAEKTELLEKIQNQAQELKEANEQLVKLNEEKNDLVGIVAHDLKSPINQIKGILRVIELSFPELGDEHKNYHMMMREVLDKSSGMIMKILDRRAVESGSITLQFEEVLLYELLTGLIKNYRKLASEKAIEIICDLDKDSKASLDRNYTSQVIDNLISNAIKFSPRDRKIYVNLLEVGGKVVLEVIDEGTGINENDLELIFEKYRKSDAKPTANESSTGLGLAIAKKFVEAMNGIIYCENVPDKGAKFTVEFPMR